MNDRLEPETVLRIRLSHTAFPSATFPSSSLVLPPSISTVSVFTHYPRGDSRSQDAGCPSEGRRNVATEPHQIESRAFSPTRGGRGRGRERRLQFFARCTCGFRANPFPIGRTCSTADRLWRFGVLRVTCSYALGTEKNSPSG